MRNKPIYMVLVGLQGAKKSTYAKAYANENNVLVFSIDEYREKMYGDASDNTHNYKVFTALYEDLREALQAGHDCILDATNTTIKSRLRALEAVNGIDCVKIASILSADVDSCVKIQEKRERKVPAEVIYKYAKSFECPLPWEGWDNIYFQGYDTDFSVKYSPKAAEAAMKPMENFSQKTPHHQKTLLGHAKAVAEQFPDNGVLRSAGLFHDIGKALAPWAWVEKPEEGVRHYYNHDAISAHMMLQNLECFECENWNETFETLWLINFHMKARDWRNSEKAYKEWESRVGKKWMEDMMVFIRADEIGSGNGDYGYHAEISKKIKEGYYVEHPEELIPEDYVEPEEKEEAVEAPAEVEEKKPTPKMPPMGGLGGLGGLVGAMMGGLGRVMPPMPNPPVDIDEAVNNSEVNNAEEGHSNDT